LIQPRTWGLISWARPDRSVPLRRLRCQSLIWRPFAFLAVALMAGRKLTKNPCRPFGQASPKGVAEEVELRVLEVSPAVRVLAVHDLRLIGVQLEPQGPEPLGKCGPQLERLRLGVAVDNNIVRIALEGCIGVLPVHPAIERVVHEEVGEQR
jgi:hypothetical protein